jgi:hypothetical protein
MIVSNVTINNNYFYNGYHTTGPDISSEINNHQFVNFTISNNVVDDSGIDAIVGNTSSNSIYVESKTRMYQDFYIYGNVVISSTARAILVVGVDGVYMYHNTVYGSHPDAQPWHLVAFGASTNNDPDDLDGHTNTLNIDMRNNIFFGTLPDASWDARCVYREAHSTFSARDYNLYFQNDAAQPITGANPNYGAESWDYFMSDWDTWRSSFGWEQNSPRPENPLLTDPNNGDVSLASTSPAVDAGVIIPGFNDNYQGNAPDIGAIESSHISP